MVSKISTKLILQISLAQNSQIISQKLQKTPLKLILETLITKFVSTMEVPIRAS